MSTEATRAQRRVWIRAVSWVAISVAIVAVLAVIAAFVVRSTGRRRRDEALARISARGEPMRMADAIRAPSGSGEDPLNWLKSFGDLPYVELDVRGLAECADVGEPGKDNFDLFKDLQLQWLDPTRIDRPTPCELAVLRRACELEDLRRAREVDRYRKFDWSRVSVDGDTMESLLPKAPYFGAVAAVEQLTQAALAAAERGDSTESVRCLASAQRAAALFEDSPTLIGNHTWVLCQCMASEAIARVAALLPRSASFDSIDATLAAIEPRTQLQRAMLGERVIGERIFTAIRNGTNEFEGFARLTGLGRFVQRTWFEHDEADYLEEMERAVASAARPLETGGYTQWEPRSYSFLSAMLLPHWSDYIQLSTVLGARLVTTRSALVAHRDGFDAAQAWAAAQRDPFSGKPLLTRVDAEGVLSIWSVGPNLVDDGGPLPPWSSDDWGTHIPPDILVRCPP
jgi:hypothetical protein